MSLNETASNTDQNVLFAAIKVADADYATDSGVKTMRRQIRLWDAGFSAFIPVGKEMLHAQHSP